jgi:hypothetical protein
MTAFTHVCRVLNSTLVRRVAGMGAAAGHSESMASRPVWPKQFSYFRSRRQFYFLTTLAAALFLMTTIPVRPDALAAYPLEICIVTGDKLDKDAVVFSYQGREIKTCCTNCVDEFYKDPAGFLAKIDEAASHAGK